MLNKTNTLRHVASAATLMIVLAACSVQLSADIVTVDMNSLTLYARKSIWIDKDSSVQGNSACLRNFGTSHNVQLQSVYTEQNVWIGRDSTVNGTVLANLNAEADRNLTFQGPSWTGKSVWVGRNSNMTGNVIGNNGIVCLEREATITGNVLGNGNININRDSTVYGDVSPGIGNSLWTGNNVTITGSTNPAAAAVNTFSLSNMPTEPDRGTYGTQNISKGNNTTATLAAGAYKTVSMHGNNTTLNLSGGTYTMKSLWVGKDGAVNVDASAGDVVLNIHNSFGTDRDVTFNKSGEGKLVINVFENSSWVGRDVTLDADVRVWNGNFGADKNFDFTGSIWADGHLNFCQGAAIYGAGNPVPEPATLVLLISGGTLIALRRHRRRA